MTIMKVLFKVVLGLEEIASHEMVEKLKVIQLISSPYGSRGWFKCEIDSDSFKDIRMLRSIIEAYIILIEDVYNSGFSIDRFADALMKELPLYAAQARKISVSAYSSHKGMSQRKIQGAISRRIFEKLNAEVNFKDYDIAIRVILLKKIVIALLDLEIQPGNVSKKLRMHPTPLLPSIAYCMIRLASPQEGEYLFDPMCGCGTIPCMAVLEWKNLKVIGADISSDYISCAKKNAEILGVADKIDFLVSDIADLINKEIKAHIIIVNPPYGMTIKIQDKIDKLYNTIIDASYKILLDQGRIVSITPYSNLIEKAIQKSKFKINKVIKLQEKELIRTIHLIKRVI